jgi:hypothetical protein
MAAAISPLLKADSAKLDILVVKPDILRVTYAGWDDHNTVLEGQRLVPHVV